MAPHMPSLGVSSLDLKAAFGRPPFLWAGRPSRRRRNCWAWRTLSMPSTPATLFIRNGAPLGRRLDSFPDIAVFAPVISLFRTNFFPDVFPVLIPAPLPQVIEGTALFGTKQAETRAIFPASRENSRHENCI